MHYDPITEEIRAVRHQLAQAFDNDLGRIAADLRQREAASVARSCVCRTSGSEGRIGITG